MVGVEGETEEEVEVEEPSAIAAVLFKAAELLLSIAPLENRRLLLLAFVHKRVVSIARGGRGGPQTRTFFV